MFSPGEATSYSRVIYCDITGREARLLLKIKGEGLGPKCRFSFDTLDIQNVFVNSAHAYEVILENRGAIEAAYSLLPSTSLFGPNFTFAPSSGVIQPGKLQAMQISFRSNELGEFDEEFQWRVEGAPHPLKLSIRGVVIGPTFQLDQTQIKFGTISYGKLYSMHDELEPKNHSSLKFCHFQISWTFILFLSYYTVDCEIFAISLMTFSNEN